MIQRSRRHALYAFALLELDGNARLGWLEKESLPEIDFFVSYQTRRFIATA
jgi:hypothetical protein